jgi:hypothetical protein
VQHRIGTLIISKNDGWKQAIGLGKRTNQHFGKRVKRGLFQASDGRCLNADSNGACNILRKGILDAFGNGRGGVGVRPVRIALASGPHGSTVHVA